MDEEPTNIAPTATKKIYHGGRKNTKYVTKKAQLGFPLRAILSVLCALVVKFLSEAGTGAQRAMSGRAG